jgi:hypothetical protein
MTSICVILGQSDMEICFCHTTNILNGVGETRQYQTYQQKQIATYIGRVEHPLEGCVGG